MTDGLNWGAAPTEPYDTWAIFYDPDPDPDPDRYPAGWSWRHRRRRAAAPARPRPCDRTVTFRAWA